MAQTEEDPLKWTHRLPSLGVVQEAEVLLCLVNLHLGNHVLLDFSI